MFATIKGLIPEPRQADQPRHYIGRHRHTPVLGLVRPRSGLADAVEPARSFTPHKPALGIAPVAPAADGRTLGSQHLNDEERVAAGTDSRQ